MSALSRRVARTGMALLAACWCLPAAATDFSLFDLLPHDLDHWLITIAFTLGVVIPLIVARLAAARARADANANAYHAGLAIPSFQNGLTITGNYLSGASLLGISAMIVTYGYDGLIYAIGFLAGWPIMTLFLAERLRNLGKFTLGDVLAYRLNATPSIRIFAASGSLVVTLLYLAAQMVGVGQLFKLLFGFEYWMGVAIIGAMMMLYVRQGGILDTAWLSIVKAVLLLTGATVLALMSIQKFGFSLKTLFTPASELLHVNAHGRDILAPGALLSDPVSLISVSLALMCGLACLPHVLMRFFTVPSTIEARKSAFWATAWSGYFYILSIVIGLGAIGFISSAPEYHAIWQTYRGGDNMVSLYLAHAVGGSIFMGVIAAVAFLTILSVMGGLAQAGSAAVSHDLYAIVHMKGKPEPEHERKASRLATLGLGVFAVLLGILAERVNMAILVAAAFSISASAHFPVLLLSMFWKRCTTRGALVGGYVGLLSALLLTMLSHPIWVRMLHFQNAPFPYASPALFSMSAAFLGIWLFSITDKSASSAKERADFEALQIRAETGVGGLN